MEVLSEHQCQGWLEGYLLTGRHGMFSSYEAFIHIVDSMVNQHAKWLKVTNELEWRRPLASLNYLLSSHVWRQDHNGFSHQDPGFIDHMVNKKAEIVRVYLPAGREHAAVHLRPLPALEAVRERRRRRQAAGAELAQHGRGDRPLRTGAGHLGLGRHGAARPGAGGGARLRRRHPHHRGARGGEDPPRADPGAADAGAERGGPDAAPGRQRAPARTFAARTSTVTSGRTSRWCSPITATPG